MNDTIDLGRYVRIVLRRWPVVLTIALIGALAGFVISRALPPLYEVEASLLATTPKLDAAFDSRLRSSLELGLSRELNRTLFNLLHNPELEARVVMAMGDALPPEQRAPGVLIERIEAVQVGGDTSYFHIRLRHRDPGTAQQLLNTWASEYSALVNELYGFPVTVQEDIRTSLATAQARLSQAEEKLETFQRETGMGLVDNIQYPASLSRQSGLTEARNLFGLYERYGAQGEALEAKNLTLGSVLAARDVLKVLIGQAEALQGRSNARGGDLSLELLSTNQVITARGRLDVAALATQDISAVLEALRAEATALDELIAALQADVLTLQTELAEKFRQLAALVRERQLAEESYIIFALKEKELETRTEVQDSWVQLVSPAFLPQEPVAPRVPLNTAVGGVLGGLLGVLAALLLGWRSENRPVRGVTVQPTRSGLPSPDQRQPDAAGIWPAKPPDPSRSLPRCARSGGSGQAWLSSGSTGRKRLVGLRRSFAG